MKRKIVAACLAFALAFGGVSYAGANTMTNAQKIQNLVDSKIVAGRDLTGNGKVDLALEDPITREEVATILVRLVDRTNLAEVLKDSPTSPFKDVDKNNWAYGYISAAAAKNDNIKPLMIGDENGNFNPKNNITYPEVATMLLRVVNPGLDESKMTYPRDHVAMAGRQGILNGIESADYSKPAQRKYVFEMLYNAKAIQSGQKLGQDDKTGNAVDLYQTAVNLINDYARNKTDSNRRIAETAIEAAPVSRQPELRQMLINAALGKTTTTTVTTGSVKTAEDAIEAYRRSGTAADLAKAVAAVNAAPENDRVALRNKLNDVERTLKLGINKDGTYSDAIKAIDTYYRTGSQTDRNKALDAIRRAPSGSTAELNNRLYEADRKYNYRYSNGYLSNDSRTSEAVRRIEDYIRNNTNSDRNRAVDAINNAPVPDRDELLRRLYDADYRLGNRGYSDSYYYNYNYFYNNNYSTDVNNALKAIEDYRLKNINYNQALTAVDRINNSTERERVRAILDDVYRYGSYGTGYYYNPFYYDNRYLGTSYSSEINNALKAIEDYRLKRINYNDASREVQKISYSLERDRVQAILDDVYRDGKYSTGYYYTPYSYENRYYDNRYYSPSDYTSTRIYNTEADRLIRAYNNTPNYDTREAAIKAINSGTASDRDYLRNLLYRAEFVNNYKGADNDYATASRLIDKFAGSKDPRDYAEAASYIKRTLKRDQDYLSKRLESADMR